MLLAQSLLFFWHDTATKTIGFTFSALTDNSLAKATRHPDNLLQTDIVSPLVLKRFVVS